ncbi:MAG: hypothetical protein M1823_005993 [Watsoniomyces obsoletus]|nr:MAG: hypothetical protein M1823_005993 [Watsoniomyces obsoletus]
MRGSEGSARIARWQDRLGEYDFIVRHRPARDPVIGIADGLSRLPTRLMSVPKAEDAEGMAMAIGEVDLEATEFDTLGEEDTGRQETDEQQTPEWEVQTMPIVYSLEVDYRSWTRYYQSAAYRDIVLLLRDGMEALKGKTQVEIRHLRRKSKRFRLAERDLPTLL